MLIFVLRWKPSAIINFYCRWRQHWTQGGVGGKSSKRITLQSFWVSRLFFPGMDSVLTTLFISTSTFHKHAIIKSGRSKTLMRGPITRKHPHTCLHMQVEARHLYTNVCWTYLPQSSMKASQWYIHASGSRLKKEVNLTVALRDCNKYCVRLEIRLLIESPLV